MCLFVFFLLFSFQIKSSKFRFVVGFFNDDRIGICFFIRLYNVMNFYFGFFFYLAIEDLAKKGEDKRIQKKRNYMLLSLRRIYIDRTQCEFYHWNNICCQCSLGIDIAYAMQLLRELFAYTLAKPPGSHSHNTIAHHFHNVRYVCR